MFVSNFSSFTDFTTIGNIRKISNIATNCFLSKFIIAVGTLSSDLFAVVFIDRLHFIKFSFASILDN